MSIPNLSCVDEALNIWRGAQPMTLDDWTDLWNKGIRHVVKLNTESEGSDFMATELGMDVTECPITETEQLWTEPEIQGLQTAVAFIQPNAFVHCGSTVRTREAIESGDFSTAGGQDRTGLVVGAYRLSQGWSKDRAYAEMKERGFHPILLGLLKAWNDLKADR